MLRSLTFTGIFQLLSHLALLLFLLLFCFLIVLRRLSCSLGLFLLFIILVYPLLFLTSDILSHGLTAIVLAFVVEESLIDALTQTVYALTGMQEPLFVRSRDET